MLIYVILEKYTTLCPSQASKSRYEQNISNRLLQSVKAWVQPSKLETSKVETSNKQGGNKQAGRKDSRKDASGIKSSECAYWFVLAFAALHILRNHFVIFLN